MLTGLSIKYWYHRSFTCVVQYYRYYSWPELGWFCLLYLFCLPRFSLFYPARLLITGKYTYFLLIFSHQDNFTVFPLLWAAMHSSVPKENRVDDVLYVWVLWELKRKSHHGGQSLFVRYSFHCVLFTKIKLKGLCDFASHVSIVTWKKKLTLKVVV